MIKKEESMLLYLAKVAEDYKHLKGVSGQQHARTISVLKKYLKTNNEVDDLNNLNIQFYKRFKRWLEAESGLQVKSLIEVEKGLRSLCKLVNEYEEREGDNRIAVESMTLTEDARKKEDKQNKAEPLTEAELEKLVALEGLTPKEQEALDIFHAECLCGQRISDIPKVLSGDGEVFEINGMKFLKFRTQKTNETAIVPILPALESIRMKYRDGFRYYHIDTTKNINQVGQKINCVLRELGKRAGLNRRIEYNEQVGLKTIRQVKPLYERIHNHTARHTFVSILHRMGMPNDIIQLVTGHTSSSMIDAVYCHVSDDDKMARLANSITSNTTIISSAVYGGIMTETEPQQTEPTLLNPINTDAPSEAKTLVNELKDQSRNIDVLKEQIEYLKRTGMTKEQYERKRKQWIVKAARRGESDMIEFLLTDPLEWMGGGCAELPTGEEWPVTNFECPALPLNY